MSRASFVKTLLTTTALAGALGASSQASAVVADFLHHLFGPAGDMGRQMTWQDVPKK
jgi:hypothetical protein